ncbi:MAG: DNA-directed DNA polymerase II small subunit [Candidatus Micrarchaeia archaeon]
MNNNNAAINNVNAENKINSNTDSNANTNVKSSPNILKVLIDMLKQYGLLLGTDVKEEDVKKLNIDIIISKLAEMKAKDPAMFIVTKDHINKIIEENNKKEVLEVKVIRSAEFKPIAAEVDAVYSIESKTIQRAEGNVNDFIRYFNSRLDRMRKILSGHKDCSDCLKNIESLKGLAAGRDVCIVGIVTTKIITKKGNIMLVVEDSTGEAKIIFMNGTSDASKKLYKSASNIINDEVVAIKGKYSDPFIMANSIIWPDIPIKDKKQIDADLAIAFVSDIHVGSKVFLENNFYHMLEWLNGRLDFEKELAGKIKYMVVGGDVADGIGVYPNQEKDLAVMDEYEQYKRLFELLELIPDYIQIFVLPGNHDSVQRAEPQPPFSGDIVKDFKKPNIHLISNPSYLTFNGVEVLTYHGTSLDSMIKEIPGLSYSKPEEVMVELLKRRHLSPIYGGNVIVPTKDDNLVIDKVPDILHMGHIHKNGLSNYHKVHIINSGTWQDRTEFQIKQGHIPTPALLPVYEMKYDKFTNVNFMKIENSAKF